MNNNYIPEVFKEKIYQTIRYIYSLSLFLISALSLLALLTFDINDNSFLTNTSYKSQNFLGDFGSYYASFIFYTFGVLGYLVILFFFIYSLLVLLNKSPKYIFIRLLLFFISLVMIPQSLLIFNINFLFIDSVETWGAFAVQLYKLYDLEILAHSFSFIGFLIYLFSQNIMSLIKFPKIKLSKTINKNKEVISRSYVDINVSIPEGATLARFEFLLEDFKLNFERSKNTSDYQILVGFKLTADQVEFNKNL